jgi:hypothetical protein
VSTGLPDELPISEIEIDVLSDSVFPPEEPMMLDGDALPAFKLPLTRASIGLQTPGRQSFIILAPAPSGSRVRVRYHAVIERAVGPLADAFPAGAALEISYTLDPRVADGDSDPSHGVFNGAVQSFSVSLPELDVLIATGPVGYVSVFDNVFYDESAGVLSDQVFVNGGLVTSANFAGGEALEELELEFFAYSQFPLNPTMIDDDTLTVSKLPLDDAYVYLRTADRPSYLVIAPARSGSNGDGCTIDIDSRGSIVAWILILPLLLACHRPSAVRQAGVHEVLSEIAKGGRIADAD